VATKVFLGLGTNVGDRRANLKQAIHSLQSKPGVEIRELSPVYETAPWGITDQPEFLNMVVTGRTSLDPVSLLHHIKAIEQEMGRKQAVRWGPRLIDIDILFYGHEVVETEEVDIPHPRLDGRVFVLAPLADLAPDWPDPRSGQTVRQMLEATGREGSRRLPLPLEWGWRTHVMGILNVTPDSFSGDGVLDREQSVEAAVAQAQRFVEDGADIIDIGGESTRPGSTPVTAEEEEARVIPVIEAVRQAIAVPISVDTYRAPVARAALTAGADWVNDVWGLRMDPQMGPLVAEAGCPVVLMHNRSRPKDVHQEEQLGGRYVGVQYDDLIADVRRELQESIDMALDCGVAEDKIILDPGVGFGKTVSQNLQLIDELDQLRDLGFPLLVGTSRKSFIGYTLDLPPQDRMEGTAATVAIAIDRGADIVRVHDVRPIARVARMTDHIVRRNQASLRI
jgi:dihydropteroate synthase/2-amino-4-hydroxy-6-hydroxymethyldihydropteridine diphosphokinase